MHMHVDMWFQLQAGRGFQSCMVCTSPLPVALYILQLHHDYRRRPSETGGRHAAPAVCRVERARTVQCPLYISSVLLVCLCNASISRHQCMLAAPQSRLNSTKSAAPSINLIQALHRPAGSCCERRPVIKIKWWLLRPAT